MFSASLPPDVESQSKEKESIETERGPFILPDPADHRASFCKLLHIDHQEVMKFLGSVEIQSSLISSSIFLPFTYHLLYIFKGCIYLSGRQNERERTFSSTGLLLNGHNSQVAQRQQPGTPSGSSTWVLGTHVSKPPSTAISRKLNHKQSSQVSNKNCSVGHQCPKYCLNHCIPAWCLIHHLELKRTSPWEMRKPK